MKWRNKFILLKSFSSMKGKRFLSACHKASVSARPVLQRSSVFAWNVFFLPNDWMWLTGQMSGYVLADNSLNWGLWEMARGAQLVSLSLLCCFCFLKNSWTFLMVNPAFRTNEQKSWWKSHKEGCKKFYASGVADSQLIAGFLAFPLLTSAYLASNLICEIVLSSYFTDSCCFPTHLCKLSALFQIPSSARCFLKFFVVPVFFWIQFLTCAYLVVSWCLYSKHSSK